MRLTVVIALYNEHENIIPLLDDLTHTLATQSDWIWDIILIIEGEDETYDLATRYAKSHPSIRILYQPQPSGLGNAFRRGFAHIDPATELVATMDGDLNHPAAELPRLVDALNHRGVDVLIGSRRVYGGSSQGTPWWKKGISYGITQILSPLFPRGIRDPTSGYRVYRAAALNQITFASDGFAFLPEILVEATRLGMKLAEEPIAYRYRKHGKSKMRFGATSISYSQFVTRRIANIVRSTVRSLRSGSLRGGTIRVEQPESCSALREDQSRLHRK